MARQVRAAGVTSDASAAPQRDGSPFDRRLAPDRLHLEVQADAGDLDVEARRQLLAGRHFEPQAAVADVHDRRRPSVGRHAEAAHDALARPAALPADVGRGTASRS